MEAAVHRVTFMIGLSTSEDPRVARGSLLGWILASRRRRQAKDVLQRIYPAGTVVDAQGWWRAQGERSLLGLVLDGTGPEDQRFERAAGAAAELARVLQQEQVAFTFEPVGLYVVELKNDLI